MPFIPKAFRWPERRPTFQSSDPAVKRRVILVRRQAPDWFDIGPDYWRDLATFEGLVFLKRGYLRGLIETWNAAFNISFFEFRGRVAQISQDNFSRLADTRLIEFEEFRSDRFDKDAIYAFTDDDDWFSPDLPLELARADIKTGGLSWRSSEFGGLIEVRDFSNIVTTNNYAILGSALARRPKLARLAEQHFDINAAVQAGKVALDTVDARLSITNKHPASTVVLVQSENRNAGRGVQLAILAAQDRARQAMDVDELGLGWAANEIEAMRKLTLSLEPTADSG